MKFRLVLVLLSLMFGLQCVANADIRYRGRVHVTPYRSPLYVPRYHVYPHYPRYVYPQQYQYRYVYPQQYRYVYPQYGYPIYNYPYSW